MDCVTGKCHGKSLKTGIALVVWDDLMKFLQIVVFFLFLFLFFFAHTEPGTLSFRGTKQKLWPAPHLLSNVALWPTFASLKMLQFCPCQISFHLFFVKSMFLYPWIVKCHWLWKTQLAEHLSIFPRQSEYLPPGQPSVTGHSPYGVLLGVVVMALAAHNKDPGLKPHCKQHYHLYNSRILGFDFQLLHLVAKAKWPWAGYIHLLSLFS